MTMNKKQVIQGFTLIETLVYLALFALIIGGMVVAAYMLFETSDRYQTRAMMQEEQNFIMAKIMRSLNNAEQICSPAVSTPGSSLSIASYGGSCGDFTVLHSDGNVTLNGSVNILNSSNIKVDQLLFTHVSGSNTDGVQIDLTVSAVTPTGKPITSSMSTTRYIRK